jgi:NitT/TauT family transport system ATP-binding protein
MNASVIVSLRGVGKTFENGTVALDGLTIDIEDGEFVSLLGPSGCGKSTALRIIAGLSDASTGAVTAPHDDLGFVFQDPTLMPWATVADNVMLPFKLGAAQNADAPEAVAQALASVGLSKFEGAFPRELSGGMKMRA